MAFTGFEGNPQRNLFLDRDCHAKVKSIEPIRVPRYAGEKTLFIHEYGDSLCLYTGTAVQVYARDFSRDTLIGNLPSGPSILFEDDGVWAALEGPVRRYDRALIPLAEEYVVPHGGPWTRGLGLFPKGDSLSIALRFSGGPRVDAPAFKLNLVRFTAAAGNPARVESSKQSSRDGDVESVVQIEDRLYLGGRKALIVLGLDGAQKGEVPLDGGFQHLTASLGEKAVGGFTRRDGRWLYLEYDFDGKPRFDFNMAGASQAGHAVFDPDGSRYLMSEKRLVKMGKDGQRQWSYTLRNGNKEAPRPLVLKGGKVLLLDGMDLVLLDPAGVQSLRLPIPAKRVVSPPFVDGLGTVWLGLSNQAETLMKVVLDP